MFDKNSVYLPTKKIAEKLDKLPKMLKQDGYPDMQAFMATYRKAEVLWSRAT